MKTNKRQFMAGSLVAGCLLVSGCATTGTGAYRNSESASQAKRHVEQAISAWSERHDYQSAMRTLHQLGDEFDWGGEERHRLAAICLIELEYGNLSGFSRCSRDLAAHVDSRTYLNPTEQHLLVVAGAMRDCTPAESLPGRGYDESRVRETYKLLGCEE